VEELDAVNSFEEFTRALEDFKRKACEIFREVKSAPNLIFVLGETGEFDIVSFDNVMNESEQLSPQLTHRQHKFRVYKSIATMMALTKVIGYIHMCEGWVLSTSSEYGAENLTKQHLDFSKVPGRKEQLLISWRYKEHASLDFWEIKRMGDEVFLVDPGSIKSAETQGNSSMFDRAVLATIGIEPKKNPN
jgi:hypothetical protein